MRLLVPRQVPQALLRSNCQSLSPSKSRPIALVNGKLKCIVWWRHDKPLRAKSTSFYGGNAHHSIRRWSSAINNTNSNLKVDIAQTETNTSTPPFAIRTALVATTTAIGTPAFPVVGAVNFAMRWVLWDKNTRYAVLGATTVLSGFATLLTMAAKDWMPIVYSYSQLFLPFAVVNGALAGTAYAALDVALGTGAIVRRPWTGAALGAFVGFVGPVSGYYDVAFQWLYDIPEVDGFFTAFLSNGFVLPISITTGLGVGLILHPLLYFPIVGIRGVHWATFSAPVLAGATLLMGYLYHGNYFDDAIFPAETYLTTEEKKNMMLLSRFHAERLKVEDWDSRVGYQPSGTGRQVRESAKAKLDKVQTSSNRRADMVFDSRRKAWLHFTTGGWIGEDMSVTKIPTESEMKQQSRKVLPGDGVISFILRQTAHPQNASSSSGGQDDGILAVQEGLLRFVKELQTPSKNNSKRDDLRARRTVAQIELASYGVAILFAERFENRKKEADLADNQLDDSRQLFRRRGQLEKLEREIRRMVPGILLYRQDEGDSFEGCSVEAQLEEYKWDRSIDDSLKEELWLQWKTRYDHQKQQALTSKLLWAVSWLSLALLFGIIGGNN